MKNIENSNLKKFIPDDYYIHIADDHGHGVKMMIGAMELITEYYADKYQAEISIPMQFDDISFNLQSFFLTDTQGLVSRLRDESKGHDEYRKSFLIGATATHATPACYIKDGDKEYFFIADSKGLQNTFIPEHFQNTTGIPVMYIKAARQADEFSCYTDAIIFGKELTAKDKDGNYQLKDIGQKLYSSALGQNNADTSKPLPVGQLPKELLKTAQITKYVEQYRDFDKVQKRKGYLRAKGVKFASLAEIQFYKKQMDEMLQHNDHFQEPGAKEKILKQFVLEAKKELKSQGVSPDRAGLYEFAQKFIQENKLQNKFQQINQEMPKDKTKEKMPELELKQDLKQAPESVNVKKQSLKKRISKKIKKGARRVRTSIYDNYKKVKKKVKKQTSANKKSDKKSKPS